MKKILVVDDEKPLRSALVEKLAQNPNYQLYEAKDGNECVEIVKREYPHLILLDLIMPNRDGFEAIKAIQNIEGIVDTPVIVVLTNKGDVTSVSKVVSLKVFQFIVKSDHSLGEIADIVEERLGE